MVTSQQDRISYGEVVKRVDLKCSHHKKEMVICDVIAVLINVMAVTILQYISVSNQLVVHLF